MEPGGKLRFEVVKPDGMVLSELIDECVIPGALGYFGVLPGHAPFLTLVGTGEIEWRAGAQRHYLAVAGGFCEVRPDRVTLLAETAERAEDIDVARVERARARAEAELAARIQEGSGEEIAAAREVLERAQVRLRVAGKRSAGAAGAGLGASELKRSA